MGDQSSVPEQRSADLCHSDGLLCQCRLLVPLTHHLLDGHHGDCYIDNKSLVEAGHIENMMQSLLKLFCSG